MTTAIQAIRVLGHEERSDPKLHIVYRIEVQASVRSWLTWRRYSEFEDLHSELTKTTGTVPPHPLPPKHRLSLFQPRKNPGFLKERVEGLEVYLRAIISSKNDTWREAYVFKEFLGVPIGRTDTRMFGPAAMSGSSSTSDASGTAFAAPSFTSSSWLDEHMELQSRIREIRADITKRDTLAERGDVSSAHMTSVQAKKGLAGVLDRLGALAGGLAQLDAAKALSGGEIQRRTDMLARLQDECQKLGKMMLNARSYAVASRNVVVGRAMAPESDREALMGSAYSSSKRDQSRPFARVFGTAALDQKQQQQPAQETEETRPLDNTGVFQLQRAKMEEQDTHLAQLSTILRRQGQLALAINQEISEHMELLGTLDQEVDSTGAKLAKAKKELKRIDNS